MCQVHLQNYLLILMINPYAVSIYSVLQLRNLKCREINAPNHTPTVIEMQIQAWQMPKVISPSFKSNIN